MVIGEFIRFKRKEKKLTLKQMAKDMGLSYSYLSQIELGDRNASPEILEKLSTILEVPHIELMQKAGYVSMNDILDDEGYAGYSIAQRKLKNLLDQSSDLYFEIVNLEHKYDETKDLNTKELIQKKKLQQESLITELANIENIIEQLKKRRQPIQQPNKVDKYDHDIAKRLEVFKNEIEHSDGLFFNGEPISEEAKESLIESLDHICRQTQRINKKYTPIKK